MTAANTLIHDRLLAWLGTGTKGWGSATFIGPKPPLLAKCFPVNKMNQLTIVVIV
jgi:hypothetical protein